MPNFRGLVGAEAEKAEALVPVADENNVLL
jgi:hypothetical protein